MENQEGLGFDIYTQGAGPGLVGGRGGEVRWGLAVGEGQLHVQGYEERLMGRKLGRLLGAVR